MDHLSPDQLLAALSWNPQIRGALYVLIALVVLPGSSYLLLSTNVGARLGFQLAAAGLFGWMTVMGVTWWVYGIGLKGPAPEWKPKSVITGEVAERGTLPVLAHFPRGWKKLDLSDPEVADAQSVVDSVLVPSPETGRKGLFASSTEYLPVDARETGGQTYGPLGLDVRPLNIFHKPHFMVIQVQKAVKPPAVAGQPPPKPTADPAAPPVAVVMVRNLGAVRLPSGLITLSSGIMFGLLTYTLHTRDKEAWARQAQKART